MSPRAFRAMGTEWWVAAAREELLPGAEAEVREAEARLSRFAADSALSRLNRVRRIEDPALARVVSAALRAQVATDGAFDPGLGAELRAWGYDRSFVSLPARSGGAPERHSNLEVRVEGASIELRGEGMLDLGGIAKGWVVDHVAQWLEDRGCVWALVDGGGDLCGFGAPWRVGTPSGHPLWVDHDAVATSSTRKRGWMCTDGTPAHHLLDGITGAPTQHSVHTVTVQAATATEADVWAKALLIRPSLMKRLPASVGQVLLGDVSGAWWMRPQGEPS